jgi:predicted porin
MKILLVAAAAATALAIGAPASAEVYGTLGYAAVDAGHVNLDTVQARLGWKSAGPFGVEGEASIGAGSDSFGGAKIRLKDQVALYGTATADVGNNVGVFARVGFANTSLDAKPGGSESHNSVNYGVGATWSFTDHDAVRADYTRVNFDANQFPDQDVWSVSYVRKFR